MAGCTEKTGVSAQGIEDFPVQRRVLEKAAAGGDCEKFRTGEGFWKRAEADGGSGGEEAQEAGRGGQAAGGEGQSGGGGLLCG